MQWSDRRLVISPYYYGLCLSEADFQKQLKRLKVPKENWPSFLGRRTANATTHFFERWDGKLCAIVTLGPTKGSTLPQINALLVHEAVHVWQACRKVLGDNDPSHEFEAYSIQAISQELMQSYAERKK